MQMKLSEWEKAIAYAKRYCEKESQRTGRDIRYKPYSMYNGNKGIAIQLYDSEGMLVTEFMSGIYNTYMDIKDSLEVQISRAVIV